MQYSTFLGTLEPTQKDTLELQIAPLIDDATDKVYIFPMSRDELDQTVTMGIALDKKLIAGEVAALFFRRE